MPLLNPAIASRARELRGVFEASDPFPHLVLDDFLDPQFCRELMEQFPAFDLTRARNEWGGTGRKAVCENLQTLGPTYRRLDALLRSGELLSLLSTMTGIPDLLYDPDYIGGGTHENLHGQELDPHVDFNYHPKTHWHRRLNLILYLNPEWQSVWGGSLELHSDPWQPPEANRISCILPLANRCVLFETSERSWHGFTAIELPPDKRELSRRSIAVYYYTRQRPRAETAPSHSTIYVQRPLPEQIRPGHTLSSEDLRALQALLARRDTQIKFLYQRELEYTAAIDSIARSVSFRAGRVLTWPLRRAARLLRASGGD